MQLYKLLTPCDDGHTSERDLPSPSHCTTLSLYVLRAWHLLAVGAVRILVHIVHDILEG